MSINVQHAAHFLGKKWCNKKVTWLATFKGKISRLSWINKKTKFNYKLNDFNATIIRAFLYIYILLFLPIIQQVLVSLLFSNNVIQKHWYYILLKLNISCYSDYMRYPEMIHNPEMIPKLTPKWSPFLFTWIPKWSWSPVNFRNGIMS